MYTIDTQRTRSQQHSEAVTAWDTYGYINTSATKPLITKQNAVRLMNTIDTLRTHSQRHSKAVTAWDRYSYRNTIATKLLITKQKLSV